MPRYNGDDSIVEADWEDINPNPFDLCIDCWDLLHLNWGDETDHPDYDDEDGIFSYRCARCGEHLCELIDGMA